MADWKPIETCPQDGLFLVHGDGMVRLLFRSKGKWSLPEFPVLKNQWGDVVNAPEGHILTMTGDWMQPTEWLMECPSPPLA